LQCATSCLFTHQVTNATPAANIPVALAYKQRLEDDRLVGLRVFRTLVFGNVKPFFGKRQTWSV